MNPIKKLQNANSRIPLKFKIWMYFIVFTVAVFVLLWIFQILFLEKFYESMKTQDASESMDAISEAYDKMDKTEFNSFISKVAVDNDLCIEVLDRYGRSIFSKDVLGDCLIHGKENRTRVYIVNILQSEDKIIRYKIKNTRTNYDMLLFGCTLGDPENPSGFILINSALVPVGSTASIIKRQLMLITAILIIVAFVISLFLSKRIARPITGITRSAERLAKGDFDTRFEGKGYLEAKQLADTAYIC